MSSPKERLAKRIACSSGALLACLTFSAHSAATAAALQRAQHPRVVVVGDSITDIAAPSIRVSLDPHYRVLLVYHDGKRIDQMLPGLNRERAAGNPVADVVENLGTNDAMQGGQFVDWQASWTQLLDSTAKVPCVVLTTINSEADWYGKKPIATDINRDIDELETSNPRRYKVVDWNSFVTKLLNTRFSKNSQVNRYLREDGIHEKAPGARWLAKEDLAALSDCGSKAEPAS